MRMYNKMSTFNRLAKKICTKKLKIKIKKERKWTLNLTCAIPNKGWSYENNILLPPPLTLITMYNNNSNNDYVSPFRVSLGRLQTSHESTITLKSLDNIYVTNSRERTQGDQHYKTIK